MKIILAARESHLADAWEKFCGDLDFITVHHGSILDLTCDAIVSPANSYGFMDGGIDALYSQRFGWKVQERLRKLILERHHGELLIGAAEIVETDDILLPYVIAAPTMRVPMVLGMQTANPFLAARAVFLLVKHGIIPTGNHAGKKVAEHVSTVAFPGLGTGVGRVTSAICARQMRQAIDEFVLEGYTLPQSWAEASERHQLLYTDQPTRLQY